MTSRDETDNAGKNQKKREDLTMSNEKINVGKEPVYDARKLGYGKMGVLGFQHMFAMFGATVTVPLLTGLNVQTTLLMAGLGTLLFHLLTKFKVPAFLGSSFAFIGGYLAIAPLLPDADGKNTLPNLEMLPYACLGVVFAGLLYLVLALVIKLVGVSKVMKLFPPVVTGPIIIAIGLGLAPSAINNCDTCWPLAIVALCIVIAFNIWGKGMAKIIPILIGVIGAYVVALLLGNLAGLSFITPIDTKKIADAAWIGLPVHWTGTVFGGVDFADTAKVTTALTTMIPIAIATMMEHIGDICAIGSTTGKDYINDPGLHRTLVGDGLATSLSSLFGGPANTTYGENTGVLALSKVYDPRVVRIAAYLAILFSFCPKFAAVINAMPAGVVGGISFVLYGMIASVGIRNMVEAQVDFTKSRNVIVAAIILVCALGISLSKVGSICFDVAGVTISLSGLAIASLVGILLNALFPDKDEMQSIDTEI